MKVYEKETSPLIDYYLNEKILQEVDKFMQLGCTFRTFQYAHGYYFPSAIKLREHMRDRYGKAKNHGQTCAHQTTH